LISEDLDETRALSDRIAVMYEGQLIVSSNGPRFREQIGLMMAGISLREAMQSRPETTNSLLDNYRHLEQY